MTTGREPFSCVYDHLHKGDCKIGILWMEIIYFDIWDMALRYFGAHFNLPHNQPPPRLHPTPLSFFST